MDAHFLDRHGNVRDALNLIVFALLVLVGTLLINSFIFRSFNVVGPSMEPTFVTGDRLIVNRLPVTAAQIKNTPYSPERGEIIVFKNPRYNEASQDEYIVKRVIAFAGERVVVKDGNLTVFNDQHPDGFDPDSVPKTGEPGSPISGEVDHTVADGALFVIGDHREGSYSADSRQYLGDIPLYDVIGPVVLRFWPLTSFQIYR